MYNTKCQFIRRYAVDEGHTIKSNISGVYLKKRQLFSKGSLNINDFLFANGTELI